MVVTMALPRAGPPQCRDCQRTPVLWLKGGGEQFNNGTSSRSESPTDGAGKANVARLAVVLRQQFGPARLQRAQQATAICSGPQWRSDL